MAAQQDEPSLESLSIDPAPTSAPASTPPAQSLTTQIPKLSEIQNIAAHVTPPTIPNSRTAPLTNHLKRSDPFQFGSRYLEESDDVYAWNAWDHVDPSKDELFVSYAEKQYAFQREHAASDFDRRRFNAEPEQWWNKFYGNNEANFFKDRKWLFQEFPSLKDATRRDAGKMTILEVGAGAGAST